MKNVSMLHSAAPIDIATEIVSVQGVTQSSIEPVFMVLSSLGVLRASLAFSCLVAPQQGDRVLLSRSHSENHILAIIERPNANDMAIAFPGNVSMTASAGSINIASQHKLALTSAEKTLVTAPVLGISSLKTTLLSKELAVEGDTFTSQWRQVNSIAKVFHLLTDTLTQRIKNSFKVVEGVDQQSSQNHIQTVDKTMTLRSRDAVITARKDMKIDGERIHMG